MGTIVLKEELNLYTKKDGVKQFWTINMIILELVNVSTKIKMGQFTQMSGLLVYSK
jgi:hypothetical protein